MNRFRSIAFVVAAALLAGTVANAANTTFFTSIGDLVFPFSPPPASGTAGAIDNMTIGATTPRAGSFTSVNNTGGGALTANSITGTDASLDIAGQAAATGTAGAVPITGGAGTAGNANGGSVVLAGGAKNGTGVAGMVIQRSVSLVAQGAPAAKTVSATLTAAEVLTGILTVNQGGAAASALQLPLATDMDTAMPDSAAGDAFDFSVINVSTVAAESASLTTNTGWTLVGDMDVSANSAATTKSAGRFRARKTGAGAWTIYRLS